MIFSSLIDLWCLSVHYVPLLQVCQDLQNTNLHQLYVGLSVGLRFELLCSLFSFHGGQMITIAKWIEQHWNYQSGATIFLTLSHVMFTVYVWKTITLPVIVFLQYILSAFWSLWRVICIAFNAVNSNHHLLPKLFPSKHSIPILSFSTPW